MANRTPDPQPPVEPERSVVQFNAVKHGIFSVSPVIPWFENEDDWEEFRNSIFESIKPNGGLEAALTDRVAALAWRLMRVIRFERESVAASLSDIGHSMAVADRYAGQTSPRDLTPETKRRMDRMAMRRLLPDETDLSKVMRYETKLHRFLLQTLHQIQALRVPTPAPRVRTDSQHTDVRRIAVRGTRATLPTRHH